MKLVDVDAELIEAHLRKRLTQRRRVHRRAGVAELGIIKPTTVHQEFRVLRRIFSVAVKKKLCPANPCTAVEFPLRVKGLFRPHSLTWSEQLKIEECAPDYLRNVIRIITETSLRVYKELASMKEQVDIANKVVFITDSKTPTGVADVPLTDMALEAFRSQIEVAGPGQWLSPSDGNKTGQPDRIQEDLEIDASTSRCSLFPALRPSLYVCHPAKCGWCRRRVGHADVEANGCAGIQEVLADETPDETGGARQA